MKQPENAYRGFCAEGSGPDPYGNPLDYTYDASVEDNPFRFSTKYWNAEVGLYDYGYRYYAPAMGRWVSRDALAEHAFQSFLAEENEDALLRRRLYDDAYTVVENNAISRIDALGLVAVASVKCTAECAMVADIDKSRSAAVQRCAKLHEDEHIAQCKRHASCTFCKIEQVLDDKGKPVIDPETKQPKCKCSTIPDAHMLAQWGGFTEPDLECPALAESIRCLQEERDKAKGDLRRELEKLLMAQKRAHLNKDCDHRKRVP